MLRLVGTDSSGWGGAGGLPQQRLTQGLDGLRVVRVPLKIAAALGTGRCVVGQDATKGDLIARVIGILSHQAAQSCDGVDTAGCGRRFGLVVRHDPVRRWRNITRHLASRLVLLRADVLVLNTRVVRVDGMQTIKVGSRKRVVAVKLCRTREACQRVHVVRIGEEDLLPSLRGHIESAANLERMRLIKKSLRRGLDGLSVSEMRRPQSARTKQHCRQ